MTLVNKSFLDYALPNQLGFQDPASPLMSGLINLHHYIMFFLVIVLFFVFTMMYFILTSFTVNNKNSIQNFLRIKSLYSVDLSHNTAIEVIWTLIPSFILLLIAIPSFTLLYAFETFMDSNISIKVVGHQWYWSYECVTRLKALPLFWENYSFKNIKILFDSYMLETEDLKPLELRLLDVTNPLVIPINTYIKLYVTASDVIHSWAVPSLGVKIDSLPGRLNEVMCFINRIGRFYGQCSELCGVKHGFMPIVVYGVSKNDYLIYCANASTDLLNFLVNDFFLKTEEINVLFNWKDLDFILDDEKYKNFIASNLLLTLSNDIKDF